MTPQPDPAAAPPEKPPLSRVMTIFQMILDAFWTSVTLAWLYSGLTHGAPAWQKIAAACGALIMLLCLTNDLIRLRRYSAWERKQAADAPGGPGE